MTEFEKQWKCGMLSGSPVSFNSGASAEEAAQFNWRAALEWVQSRLKFGSEVAYSTDDILMAIKKEIREELDD